MKKQDPEPSRKERRAAMKAYAKERKLPSKEVWRYYQEKKLTAPEK